MARTQSAVPERMQKSILHGPIVRTLLVLGWPIMLTNVFQMLYNLVDTYWLGKVSVEAVAAANLAWPLVFLFVSVAAGLGVAGVALVSQHAGAGNETEARRSAGQVMSLLTILSIVMSVLGVLGTDFILHFMGAAPDVVGQASPYIKVIFAGMPFMFIVMVYSFILRGWGDTRTPMYIIAFSVGLNMVLDPILILGVDGLVPAYGILGAGIATLISRSIGGFVALHLLFRGKRTLTISVSDLKIEKDRAKQIFKIGIPASVGHSMVALGFVIMVAFTAGISTEVLAAYGIGDRVIGIVFIITGGLTGAAVTMMGQCLGAQKKERASKILYRTMALTAVFLFVCSAIFYVFRAEIIGVFIDDAIVIEEGARFFALFGLSIAFFGIFATAQSAFMASGHTVPTMVLGIVRLWMLRIPFSFVLAFTLGYGASGIWIGMALSNLVSAILAVIWVSRGTWQRSVIAEPPKAKDVAEVL